MSSDTAGGIADGVRLLTRFDEVMRGALSEWSDDEGVMIIISDHGNMEDLSHGKHTENDVPGVVIGRNAETILESVETLADLVGAMHHYFDL